jgi:hypothetical protein
MRSESAKQNDTFMQINGKWVFDRDWVDGIKIHKCVNAYLVYVKMLRSSENSKAYGQEYEITISFPTLDELLDFQYSVFSDDDLGSSKLTEKFRNYLSALIPVQK